MINFLVYLLVFFIAFIVLAVYMHINSNSLEVSEYTYTNKKIPKGFDNKKILHISDLHSKNFGVDNILLKELIKSQSPDVVFFTGDVVDGDGDDYKNALDMMNFLSSNFKTYYIEGNHEQKSLLKKHRDKYIDYFKKLDETGIVYLDNSSVILNKNFDIVYNKIGDNISRDKTSDTGGYTHKKGDTEFLNERDVIRLYGFTAPFSSYKYFFSNRETTDINCDYINEKLGKVDREYFSILLAHNALDFIAYSNWGADMIFSGHVHGGLIRLPFLGGILSPDRSFFPRYSYGRYDRGKSTMYVSKGLGGSKVGVRFRCKPEISIINIKSK